MEHKVLQLRELFWGIVNRYDRAFRILLYILTTALFLLLIKYHFQVISFPAPIDYFEGTMPAITDVLIKGESPYSFKNQPEYNYVYPPLYNYITAPFAKAFGNTLLVHRIVSATFIGLSLAFLFYILWRCSRDILFSYIGATTAYAAFLFYSTSVASTNSTGLFFFLCTVFIPWLLRFSWPGLALAIVSGILAFYSKQYFVVGLALVSVTLLVSESIKKAVIFGFLSACALLGSLVVVAHSHPYFLDNTLFGVFSSSTIAKSNEHMLSQMGLFIQLYACLLLLTIPFVALSIINAVGQIRRDGLISLRGQIQFGSFNRPLIATRIDYFLICFLLATAAIVLSLGKHRGNYMTYYFQLMSPFLLILCFTLFSKKRLKAGILLPFILVLYYQVYFFLPQDFSVKEERWSRVYSIMDNYQNMFVSPILISEMVRTGKPLRQAGQTFYFPLAIGKPDIFLNEDPDKRVEAIWDNYIEELYNDIRDQKFEAILITKLDILGIFVPHMGVHHPPPNSELSGEEFLYKYYEETESVGLSLSDRPGGGNYGILVFKPKTSD